MTAPLPATDATTGARERDPLYRLLLRVARRADALTGSAPSGGNARRDRETWRRAETELLGGLEAVHFSGRTQNGASAARS